MPFLFDSLPVAFPPVTLAEIDGANKGPQFSFWQRLWSRLPPKPEATPWGEIDDWAEVAPGILWFKTARRTGYRLSPRRQRALPHYLRTVDGWYEDTSEWACVAVVFDRIFDKMPTRLAHIESSIYHIGKETLKNWHPEKYEAWFQMTLDAVEIANLEITRFYRQHADRWIAIEALDHQQIADRQLLVRAKRGGDPPYTAETGVRASRIGSFLVDADEFAQRRGKPFLVDPARHFEINSERVAECDKSAAFGRADAVGDGTAHIARGLPPLVGDAFAHIAEAANDIIIVTTAELAPPGPEIVFVNQSFTRLTGYAAVEALGRSPRFLQGPGTSRTTLDAINDSLRRGLPVHEKVLNFAKGGTPYWVDMRIMPLRDVEGAITHFAAIERDVTMDKWRLDELELLANRDTLTGIPNRLGILKSLLAEIDCVKALDERIGAGRPCLALICVDGFKQLKDEKGHALGDAVLCGVADRLAEIVRRSDTLGRIGGEEFAVCMPRVTRREAKAIAERLRRAVAAQPFETPRGPLPVTVSIGVAAFEAGDIPESLMKRADAAMRSAKQASRDRVKKHFYESSG